MRCRRHLVTSSLLFSLLLGLAPAGILPAWGDGPSVEMGTFFDSPRGYLGCVVAWGTGESKTYCFVAYVLTEGPDAGFVRIIAKKVAGERFVEDLIVQRESLQVGTDPAWGPSLHFAATLPRIGEVAIDLRAQAWPDQLFTRDGCFSTFQAEVVAREEVILNDTSAQGTVAGEAVVSIQSGCHGYFVGPASGAWRMIL